ncbi:hypothetical protein ACROYT_G018956 [Oculina patagonica]
MASSSGTSLEQRRWLVVGIALQNVLTPCLRDKIQNEMTPFYQHMVRNFGLDKQTYAAYQKTIAPSTVKLNYGSINNNATLHPSPRHFDYCVMDEVSLAKLFMKPFMAHFNTFDSSFDTSAALAVLCGAAPFMAAKPFAEDVRSIVRNEWAHCDFKAWTAVHYDNCFDLMKSLVKNLVFPVTDNTRILGELELWRTQGLEICLGKLLDDNLLHVIRNEVRPLSEEKVVEKMRKLSDMLDLFKSEFDSVQERLSTLENTCEEIKDEMNTKDIYSRQIVFDAPDRNRCFTGREKEIATLEECLPFESDKALKMSAICGLGGCGKTTLAAHFAWKRKP